VHAGRMRAAVAGVQQVCDITVGPHADLPRATRASGTSSGDTAASTGEESPVTTRPPVEDQGDEHLEVGPPKRAAAGVPGVWWAIKQANEQMGLRRTAATLPRLNQVDGFDCPGCAWPEAETRHLAEF